MKAKPSEADLQQALARRLTEALDAAARVMSPQAVFRAYLAAGGRFAKQHVAPSSDNSEALRRVIEEVEAGK